MFLLNRDASDKHATRHLQPSSYEEIIKLSEIYKLKKKMLPSETEEILNYIIHVCEWIYIKTCCIFFASVNVRFLYIFFILRQRILYRKGIYQRP